MPGKSARIIKRKLSIVPQFHQTDMMGVIHNAEYFKWFEEGRFQIMAEIMPLDEAIRRGVALPVISNSCNYKNFVKLGDALILITEHEILESYSGKLRFKHILMHEKKKIEMAVGESVSTIFDMNATQLVWRWPEDLWEKYQNLK
jgi:acyl-CoA thioester hydrolase